LGLSWFHIEGLGVSKRDAVKWFRIALKSEEGENIKNALLSSPAGKKFYEMMETKGREVDQVSEEEEQLKAKRQTDVAIDELKQTCLAFGFTDGSKEMSTCLFDLYKLKQQNDK